MICFLVHLWFKWIPFVKKEFYFWFQILPNMPACVLLFPYRSEFLFREWQLCQFPLTFPKTHSMDLDLLLYVHSYPQLILGAFYLLSYMITTSTPFNAFHLKISSITACFTCSIFISICLKYISPYLFNMLMFCFK